MRTLSVKILTLCLLAITLSGCSAIHHFREEPCKSHAYIRVGLEDYISKRFDSQSQVRIGIIPFSVPANLSNFGGRSSGVGQDIASRLHTHLLRGSSNSIIEVFPRDDWPGKQEEFFRGNFGALSRAHEAGYDLVLIGILDNMRTVEEMSAHSKIIDVDNGVTVWYGSSTATIPSDSLNNPLYLLGLDSARPDKIQTNSLVDLLSECMSADILNPDDIESEGLPTDSTIKLWQ